MDSNQDQTEQVVIDKPTMPVENVLSILIQCANFAQKGGVLSLKDAATVSSAVDSGIYYIKQIQDQKTVDV